MVTDDAERTALIAQLDQQQDRLQFVHFTNNVFVGTACTGQADTY